MFEFKNLIDASKYLEVASSAIKNYSPYISNFINNLPTDLNLSEYTGPIVSVDESEIEDLSLKDLLTFISETSSFVSDMTDSTLKFARDKYKDFSQSSIYKPFCEAYANSMFKTLFGGGYSNPEELCCALRKACINSSFNTGLSQVLANYTLLDPKKHKNELKVFGKALLKNVSLSNVGENLNKAITVGASAYVTNYFTNLKDTDLADIVAHGVMGYLKDYTLSSSLSAAAKRALFKNSEKYLGIKKDYKNNQIIEAGEKYYFSKILEQYYVDLERSYLPEYGKTLVLASMMAINVYLSQQLEGKVSTKTKASIMHASHEIDRNTSKVIAPNMNLETRHYQHRVPIKLETHHER